MCKSTRLTAAFLSKRFNRKFSRRPVEDILKKVKLNQIVVTPEQLAAAARQHPRSEHFAEMCPEVLDPNSKMEIVDTPTPAAKKAAATKRQAKKVGKAATPPLKKTPESKQIEEDAPQPPIQPTVAALDGVNGPHAKHMTPEGIQAALALLDAADQEDEEFHK